MVQPHEKGSVQGSDFDRLAGWKDIANHLGKSMRTVQRWEREIGLPVHRLPSKTGEIIYALRSELAEWQAAREKLKTAPAPSHMQEGGEIGEPRSVSAYRRWSPIVGIILASLTAAVFFAWCATSATKEPIAWRVDDNKLKILDARGRVLWEYLFDFPLVEVAYKNYSSRQGSSLVSMEDLDNDGSKEVLFLAWGYEQQDKSFYCFNSDGTRRFSWRPGKGVRFGESQYAPPFAVMRFLTTSELDGTKRIWLVSQHNLWFPAAVHKLTPQGELKGEYWSNGHITLIMDAQIRGHRVLLVGGTNNEHRGASLAVLDYEQPNGSTPAVNPSYRCRNCLPGEPLAFFVFPSLEISRELDMRPWVSEIRTQRNGAVLISVLHAGKPDNSDSMVSPVFYQFGSNLQIMAAEIGDAYRQSHVRLELAGRIRHRFGKQDEREAFPILAWNGRRFVSVDPSKSTRAHIGSRD